MSEFMGSVTAPKILSHRDTEYHLVRLNSFTCFVISQDKDFVRELIVRSNQIIIDA